MLPCGAFPGPSACVSPLPTPPTARQNPVVSTSQFLLRSDLPCRRRSEGSKATSSLRGPHWPASLSARPCHLFKGRIGRPRCQEDVANPARSSLDPAACGPEIDRSRARRSFRRFRNRPPACLAAAALAVGPIVAKGSSPICRRRRLDAPSEKRPPSVSAFDAINTCGIFVTGQDAKALRIARGNRNGGPTWQTWVPILRAKGGSWAGRAMEDGRGETPRTRKTERVSSGSERKGSLRSS